MHPARLSIDDNCFNIEIWAHGTATDLLNNELCPAITTGTVTSVLIGTSDCSETGSFNIGKLNEELCRHGLTWIMFLNRRGRV